MAGSDGGKTWLKYGCFGCLGLVGIAVLLTAMLVGIALVKVESEEVEDHASTPEVSAGQAPLPGESFASLPPGGSGTIVLDLRNGAFAVEPAASGEPLQVEAKYDRNTYELSEVVETDEQGQWTYRLSFQRTGSAWITTIKELLGGTSPFVRVLLPPDVALDLELKVKSGGGEVELGGLWLTSADLTLDKGGLALEISEPLQAPMERMDIKAQMGGGALGSLGNASPRALNVDCAMGGFAIDLRGRWVEDSDISITASMSGTEVRLPRDVLIEGVATDRVGFQPESETKLPTLRFTVSNERGEIEFID
jgi:hypothetical protein